MSKVLAAMERADLAMALLCLAAGRQVPSP